MSRAKEPKGAGALQDKLLLVIGCLQRASRILKQVEEDSGFPKLLCGPESVESFSCVSDVLGAVCEAEGNVHSLLDNVVENLGATHPLVVASTGMNVNKTSSNSSAVATTPRGKGGWDRDPDADAVQEDDDVEDDGDVRIIKKGSRELLSIMRSNQRINYENERHVTYKKSGGSAATSPEGAQALSGGASSSSRRPASSSAPAPSSGVAAADKKAPPIVKKRKDSVGDDSSGPGKKAKVEKDGDGSKGSHYKPLDTTVVRAASGTGGPDETSVDKDVEEGSNGRRRWELRRMRLQDRNALELESDSSDIPAAKSKIKSGANKPATPRGSAVTPRSPVRESGNSSAGGSRPSLWSTKNEKDKDGHSVSTPMSASSWVCAVCTLENSMRARNCLACYSHRSNSVKLPPGSNAGPASGVALDSALEENFIALEDVKKPRTPRAHVPSQATSLHPYREPKVGPEFQIAEDALPMPRDDLTYDLRMDRYCPSGTLREESLKEEEGEAPVGTNPGEKASDINNIYWEMVWFPSHRHSPDGSITYIDVQKQYLDVLFPGCSDNRIIGDYKDIDHQKRGKVFGGELEMESLRLLFRNKYNLRKALARMDDLKRALEDGVGGDVPAGEKGRYGHSLITAHIPGLFARSERSETDSGCDTESDSEGGGAASDNDGEAENEKAKKVCVDAAGENDPAAVPPPSAVMGDSGRIPKKPRGVSHETSVSAAPSSSSSAASPAAPQAPVETATTAVPASPASLKAAILGLTPRVFLFEELAEHMAVYWKDWNMIAVGDVLLLQYLCVCVCVAPSHCTAFCVFATLFGILQRAFAANRDGTGNRDSDADSDTSPKARVRVADLQQFYYSHMVVSGSYKVVKKEVRAKFRRNARANHQKRLQLQKQNKAALASAGGGGGAVAASPLITGTDSPVASAAATGAVLSSSVCPILSLPPCMTVSDTPEPKGDVGFVKSEPAEKLPAVTAYGSKWNSESPVEHQPMNMSESSTEAKPPV